MFSAPIPGQSLTSEPKNSPWENPPEMNTPEDAVLYHLKRLDKPDKIKATLQFLELGYDVVTLTEGLLRAAVADGRHSIDISLIIAPIIHEFITNNAKVSGIDFDEGIEDKNEIAEEDIEYNIQNRQASKIIGDYKDTGKVDMSDMEEPQEEMSEPVAEEIIEKPKSMGLMSRRTV